MPHRPAPPKPTRSLRFRTAQVIAAAVIAAILWSAWLSSRTRVEFQLRERDGTTVSTSTVQISWRGKPYVPGVTQFPGYGRYRIDSDVFEVVEGTADVRFGQTTTAGPIILTRGRGSVRITTDPPAATVVQEGRTIGKTPFSLRQFPAGILKIQLRLGRHYAVTLQEELKKNKAIDIHRKLDSIYGRRSFDGPSFHFQTWGRGVWYSNPDLPTYDPNVPVGNGVDIRLAYADVSPTNIELAFEVSAQRTEILLYGRENASIENFWGQTEQKSERLFVVDNRGVKFYTTTGFIGGRQEQFNKFATAIRLRGGETVLLRCRFPMISRDAAMAKFVCPDPDHGGHQQEWWWNGIPIFQSSDFDY